MPIMIIVFVNINYEKQQISSSTNHILEKEIDTYQNKLNKLKINQKDVSILEAINLYENLAYKLKIDIINLSVNNKIINLKYKSKYKNAISYIKSLEKIDEILSYDILYEKTDTIVNVQINTKNTKNINTINPSIDHSIKNPFKENNNSKSTKAKAIIDNFVMLDGKWYMLNDIYKKSKIIKISKNTITLEYKNKITILRIFDDE